MKTVKILFFVAMSVSVLASCNNSADVNITERVLKDRIAELETQVNELTSKQKYVYSCLYNAEADLYEKNYDKALEAVEEASGELYCD